MRKRRTWAWLLGAALLLGLGVTLSSWSDPEKPPEPPKPNLPRGMGADEHLRAQQRRVLPVPPLADAGGELAAEPFAPEPTRMRDPLLAALSPTPKETTMVIEANALWNSELREPLMACLFDGEQNKEMLGQLSDAGFDLQRDLDRFAIREGALLVSGHFENVNWKAIFGDSASLSALSPSTTLIRDRNDFIAVWKQQLVIMGRSEEEVLAAVNRLENPSASSPQALPESESYGEAYGRIDVERLSRMAGTPSNAPSEMKELFELLQKGAQSITFHVDASHDVGMVFDINGNQSEETQNLRKSLAGALSFGRLKAKAEGDDRLLRLLDMAQVLPAYGAQNDRFRFELALPHAFVVDALRECAAERQARGRAFKKLDGGHSE